MSSIIPANKYSYLFPIILILVLILSACADNIPVTETQISTGEQTASMQPLTVKKSTAVQTTTQTLPLSDESETDQVTKTTIKETVAAPTAKDAATAEAAKASTASAATTAATAQNTTAAATAPAATTAAATTQAAATTNVSTGMAYNFDRDDSWMGVSVHCDDGVDRFFTYEFDDNYNEEQANVIIASVGHQVQVNWKFVDYEVIISLTIID